MTQSSQNQGITSGPCLSPSKKAQFGAYAFFPGTGPNGKRCSDCLYRRKEATKSVCAMVKAFPGNYKATPIDPSAASCKYFQRGQ